MSDASRSDVVRPNVTSEVGRLRTVMLHRPGPELQRLTPRNNDKLLFDGIPWVSRAQDEHDAFAETLRSRGVADLAQVTLLSDGTTVYECTSAEEVVDLLQGGQGVFGIAIGGVWQEIEGTLAELPSERTAEADEAPSPGDELAARRAARKTG